jgi:alcohol dehydrogenase
MVTGVAPHDEERLGLAKDFGADLAVDVGTTDAVKAVRKETGGGADVVVDVTAKAPAALGQAINIARAGGTIVMAGTRGSAETPGFWPDLIVFKELRILGALGVDAPAYRAALDLLASNRYPFADLPRRRMPLDGADELLRSMAGEGDRPPPVHGVITP